MSFRRIRQKIDGNHSYFGFDHSSNSPLKHKAHFIRQLELFKRGLCELRIALHPMSFNIFICLRSADLLTCLQDQDRVKTNP
jgi:hypothetical protein